MQVCAGCPCSVNRVRSAYLFGGVLLDVYKLGVLKGHLDFVTWIPGESLYKSQNWYVMG